MVFCNMNYAWIIALIMRHNPYFSRWFSAISDRKEFGLSIELSQSLF